MDQVIAAEMEGIASFPPGKAQQYATQALGLQQGRAIAQHILADKLKAKFDVEKRRRFADPGARVPRRGGPGRGRADGGATVSGW